MRRERRGSPAARTPDPLIQAVRSYLPPELDLRSVRETDRRLSDLNDRALFIALYQLGLGRADYEQLKDARRANRDRGDHQDQLIVIAIEGLGPDPLRAVGARSFSNSRVSLAAIGRGHRTYFVSPTVAALLKMHGPICNASGNVGARNLALWRRVGVSEDHLVRPVLAEA